MEYTEANIKTVLYACSKDEKKGISVKFVLKGRYNTFNVNYHRKVKVFDEKTQKEYNELSNFIEGLKKASGVNSVDALVGQKVNVEFDGINVKSFKIIENFTPIKK